ncbi:MAG: Ig-like domain-containing protein [Acidobacteriia bacterium]|nr:Ig-like domain-containing protein [Terriglobia bacterium]
MKQAAAAMAIVFAGMMIGCSSGNSAGVSVTISPTSATVPIGRTQQFTATVNNAGNNGVTWQVNGVVGGNSNTGTITSSGLYTAPLSPTTVTVTAVSVANTTQAASATVTVALPISITPTTAAINLSGTVQFTATVTFSSNTTVTWEVNGTSGGNASIGTISSSGLYTAPASIPNPNIVTITAVAQADTTQTASATVTINPPPLVITPTGLTMAAGAQQTFTATVNGASVTPVWSVACKSQLAAGCGSISSGGVYVAPSSPPPGGSVTVTAKMADGSAVPASTNVSVQFSNASLAGSYAYAFSIRTSQKLSAEAGTIACDGNGNITGGTIDRSDDGGTPIAITGGTYQIGDDGRGTAVVDTDQGPVGWQFVLTNQPLGYVVRFDANGATASGTLELQHPDKFGLASIQGNYAASLVGVSAGSSPVFIAMIGSLAADGAGHFTRGILDVNNNSSISTNLSATGTYSSPSSSGRGTFTLTSALGTQTFAYYQVDDTRLKLVEIDGASALAGEVSKQPPGPFTNASFNGRYALAMAGVKGGSTFGMGGLFTMNLGEITNRLLDGVNQTVFDSQGGYSVTDSTLGRTTVNWTVNNGAVLQYVLYPRSDGGFAMLEIDGTAAAEGIVLPQTLSSPSTFSQTGNFAVTLTGGEPPSSLANESITGQFVLPGGAAFSGALDIDENGATTQGGAFQVGVFTVDVNSGRGVATALPSSSVLSNASFILYILDADKALILENDNARVLTGVMTRQY